MVDIGVGVKFTASIEFKFSGRSVTSHGENSESSKMYGLNGQIPDTLNPAMIFLAVVGNCREWPTIAGAV